MRVIETAEVKRMNKPFEITSVCRVDLEQAGFDTKDVDDAMMPHLASKMADAYCNIGFWESMEVLAEHLGVKKREL